MKKKTGAACVLAVLFIAGTMGATGQITAHAERHLWAGTIGAGPIPIGEECPVKVEHEQLTLNIPALPQYSYSSQEEFEQYSASVTAEYTFYNPTDTDVEMSLAVPLGVVPDYAYAGHVAAQAGRAYFDDAARYSVTAEGETVKCKLRHTNRQKSFAADDVYSISDEKREHELFAPELPTTRYTYKVNFPRGATRGLPELVFNFDAARTRMLCWLSRTATLDDDGNVHLYVNLDKESPMIDITVVGDTPELLSITVREDISGVFDERNDTIIKGATVRELSKEEMTFGEYVEAARLEGVSEVDFYNCYMDWLSESADKWSFGRLGIYDTVPERMTLNGFMRWYTYSLKIPAGERLTNTVTVPLYPEIDEQRCRYEYLLAPAQRWKNFGTLDIIINTDLEILNPSLDFTKTEGGYSLHIERLPQCELSFSIAGEYEYPRRRRGGLSGGVLLVLLLVVLVAVSTVAEGIAVGIVFGVIRAKKKKQNK